MTNQLPDLLWRYFPEVVRLSPALDEPWVWDLLALVPLPEEASELRRSCMEKILRSHRIRRLTAQDVCVQLKTQALQLAPGAAAATAEHVLLLLPLLRTLHTPKKTDPQPYGRSAGPDAGRGTSARAS